MTTEDAAAVCRKVRWKRFSKGPGFVAECPSCESDSQHLSVCEYDGWWHVKCIKGCSEASILSALGLQNDDRRVEPPDVKNAVYTYTDSSGAYLFEKVRYLRKDGKKGFVQQVRERGGQPLTPVKNEWGRERFPSPEQAGLNGQAKVLYRLPSVLRAVSEGATVYIGEGEKAADALHRRGLCGTCQPDGAGAGKWQASHSAFVRDAKEIVIVADRDPAGDNYSRGVFLALTAAGCRNVRVVRSATEGEKDDAYDHLAAGYGEGEFVPAPDLMRRAPAAAVLAERTEKAFDVKDAFDYEPETPNWLVEGFVRKSQINLVDARESGGKSTFCLAIAAAGSNGKTIFGEDIEPFGTLYFSLEDSGGEIRKKFEDLGGKPGFLKPFGKHFVLDRFGMERVADTIQKYQSSFVVFDPLKTYVTGIVRNPLDGLQWIPIFEGLRDIAVSMRIAIEDVRHHAAMTTGRDFSEMGSGVQEWRSLHRTHTAIVKHPDSDRFNSYRYCVPCRGSLNSVQADIIGFEYRRGVFGWDFEPDLTPLFEAFGTKEQKKRGPKTTLKADASVWLASLVLAGTVMKEEVRKAAANAGFSPQTLYKAAESLGLETVGNHGSKAWKFPEQEKDPFNDD